MHSFNETLCCFQNNTWTVLRSVAISLSTPSQARLYGGFHDQCKQEDLHFGLSPSRWLNSWPACTSGVCAGLLFCWASATLWPTVAGHDGYMNMLWHPSWSNKAMQSWLCHCDKPLWQARLELEGCFLSLLSMLGELIDWVYHRTTRFLCLESGGSLLDVSASHWEGTRILNQNLPRFTFMLQLNALRHYDVFVNRFNLFDCLSPLSTWVLSHNTGYVTCPLRDRPAPLFRSFYSYTNNSVQLEDTTIKTERGCSMQRTEGMTVAHHRSDWIYHVKRVDWQEEWGETDKMMAEEFKKKRL